MPPGEKTSKFAPHPTPGAQSLQHSALVLISAD
jgi:hypothetical protein